MIVCFFILIVKKKCFVGFKLSNLMNLGRKKFILLEFSERFFETSSKNRRVFRVRGFVFWGGVVFRKVV